MHIIVVGLNHKVAPVEMREKLAFTPSRIPEKLSRLVLNVPLTEGVILSTCNRVEIYGVGDDFEAAVKGVEHYLGQEHNMPVKDFTSQLYRYQGSRSISHLFSVACGVDSLVVGETEIVGQIKSAYKMAREAGTTGPVLNKLFQSALRVAKEARSITDISRGTISVSSVAVELAKRIFGNLEEKVGIIIGAGEMGEQTAQHLSANGIKEIIIASRTLERAEVLCRKLRGRAVPFQDWAMEVVGADIVISSSGAPYSIIKQTEVKKLMRKRRNRPVFFIDIAVPRDIEPLVGELDNVFLYDIDDLQQIAEANRIQREKEITRCRQIIADGEKTFFVWLRTFNMKPVLQQTQNKLDEIRSSELERTLRRLSHLPQYEREEISSLTKRIMNKVFHFSIQNFGKPATARNKEEDKSEESLHNGEEGERK